MDVRKREIFAWAYMTKICSPFFREVEVFFTIFRWNAALYCVCLALLCTLLVLKEPSGPKSTHTLCMTSDNARYARHTAIPKVFILSQITCFQHGVDVIIDESKFSLWRQPNRICCLTSCVTWKVKIKHRWIQPKSLCTSNPCTLPIQCIGND